MDSKTAYQDWIKRAQFNRYEWMQLTLEQAFTAGYTAATESLQAEITKAQERENELLTEINQFEKHNQSKIESAQAEIAELRQNEKELSKSIWQHVTKIERLQAENERLRGAIKEALTYIPLKEYNAVMLLEQALKESDDGSNNRPTNYRPVL